MSQANPLARLESAHRMLAEARTVDEVKEVRDKAEVARLYARERDLGLEAQNYAAEIKIRAERKLGELLAETVIAHRPPKVSDHTTLTELGISRDESSRWQQMASIPEPVFEQYIAETKATSEPLTTAGVVRVADLAARGFDPSTLPPMRMSRAEHAYFAIPKLLQWVDIDPAEVADAADADRIRVDIGNLHRLSRWLSSLADALEDRASQPLHVVDGGAHARGA